MRGVNNSRGRYAIARDPGTNSSQRAILRQRTVQLRRRNRFAAPVAVFAPHSSADGITFYDGAEFGADYADSAFVTEWGANVGGPTGRRVMRVVLSGSGASEHGQVSDFATGFSHPLAILEAPDGGLLVGDYGTGQVTEIFRTS